MPEIKNFLLQGSKVFIVGAGGVSMSALAEVLHSRGAVVAGADRGENASTRKLEKNGIHVSIGESPEILGSPDCVIRTAAAKDDNPIIAAARTRGIPVFERADAWGSLMLDYKHAVCVAGTHGKTSTTSMLTHIAMAAGRDPTVMLGGTLPLLSGGHRVGHGDLIIMESCEYCNSFLKFTPTIAVILNVEADHLDFFSGLDDVIESFCRFADKTTPDGSIIINGDDPGAVRVGGSLSRKVMKFGRNEAFRAEDIRKEYGRTHFNIMHGTTLYASVSMSVPGDHNVSNALAAACASFMLGIDGTAVREGLMTFRGAGRRMEYKGKMNGIPVYDDYAHHPTEIEATLKAAGELGYKRILCVFQPHTYSRTYSLMDDFAGALSIADKVFLADIYAARENNTLSVSSGDLARKIRGAEYEPDFAKLAGMVKGFAEPGDMILTMGAGNIDEIAKLLVVPELL